MALPTTGYIDFNWTPTPDVDGYYLHVYKNGTNFNTFNLSTNSFRLSGLKEGDFAHARVYSYIGSNTSRNYTSLARQTIPVFNFHVSGKTFEFNKLSLNNKSLNFSETVSGYHATGQYSNNQSLLSFSVINPRDDSTLSYFGEDPFFSGAQYKAKRELTELESFDLNSFTFSSKNSYDSRNYTAQIVVNDYYGSGITGNIHLNNEPISINSVTLQNAYLDDSTATISIIPKYSTTATGVEYILYDDDTLSTYHNSGITASVSNFSTTIPFDSTGFLHLRPYDWFGSGHLLERNQLIYLSSEEFIPKNAIKNFRIENDETPNYLTVYADYNNITTSGSYFTLSIDPDASQSFGGDSYFTGVIEDLTSGFLFNSFDNRTGDHENFYFNLNLHQSGSNSFEDSAQKFSFSPKPKFLTSGISFDYVNGITTLEFDSEPEYSFSGIDVLFSGQDTMSYELYSGTFYQSGDIEVQASVKLVNSDDNSQVFDQINFSGSGDNQFLKASLFGGAFNAADGLIYFSLENSRPSVSINSINVYSQPSLVETSISIGEELSGVRIFKNYTNHFQEVTSIGNYPSLAPTGMGRNIVYDSTGVGFTGEYESGRHFVYRFEPVNGYGTGQATDPITAEYTLNPISENTENALIDLEGAVSELGSTISYYITTSGIESGVCHMNVDWSTEFDPSTAPIISSNVISYNPDDHIIGSQISGFPTISGATFIFTDDIPNTGYFLNITAIEPL
ncbi:MAG: hypothetical protein L7S72_03680 [Flavobacteriales bacterium]|nr:hypothetical protein [Gammaproteobacteria bacterium]MCH1612374.1 hypothetical protein [Flavobacteriales bacterium]